MKAPAHARRIGFTGALVSAVLSASCSLLDSLDDIRVMGASADPTEPGDAASATSDAVSDSSDVTASPDGTSAPTVRCPDTRGPSMVTVHRDGGPSHCIDSTEITNAQYAEFVSTVSTADVFDTYNSVTSSLGCPPLQASEMAPSKGWPTAASLANRPVVYVGWCKAITYCRWAGKTLCGASDGGVLPAFRRNDPTASVWFAACSQGGERPFAYGASYVAGACNVGTDASTEVGALPGCQGGVKGLFDMNGNVSEWELSFLESGGVRYRVVRGGSWYLPDPARQSCAYDFALDDVQALAMGSFDTGFRCCASPLTSSP